MALKTGKRKSVKVRRFSWGNFQRELMLARTPCGRIDYDEVLLIVKGYDFP